MKIKESQLRNIIAEAVKKSLNEGTTDQYIIDAWYKLKETIGAEKMLDCIFSWSSTDQLAKYIEWFKEEEYLAPRRK